MATMALQSSAPTRRGWGPFAVFRRGRTYLNLLYLLLALPLSYVYAVMFTNLLTGLVVSISIVALPLLVLVGAPVLAVFERFLAGGLLGVSFTPMAAPLEPDASLWDRLAAYLCNPVTWKSILYLIIRLPFGVIAFVLTLGLLSTALLSVCAPLVYLNAGGLAALHWGGWVPIFGYGIDRGPLAALS